MKKLSEVQLVEINGGASGYAYCGVAMGLAVFGGPAAWVAAGLFCVAVTPTDAY